MVNYLTTVTRESGVVPGVVYHLRKPSHKRRVELLKQIAGELQMLSDLENKRDKISEEIERAEAAARIEPCTCAHEESAHHERTLQCMVPDCTCRKPRYDKEIGDPDAESAVMQDIMKVLINEVFPKYIPWAWVKIEGFKIEGQDPDAQLFLAEAPEHMIQELGWTIHRLTRMDPKDLLDFKWPTTSGAAEGARQESSTANTADSPASI